MLLERLGWTHVPSELLRSMKASACEALLWVRVRVEGMK